MRLLAATIALVVSLTCATTVGAAVTALDSHDRQAVVSLYNQLKVLNETKREISAPLSRSTLAAARRCADYSRNESVSETVVFAVTVLNVTSQARNQYHALWSLVRSQAYHNEVLVRYMALVKKVVTYFEKAGALNHPVAAHKVCSILSRVNQLVASDAIGIDQVFDKVTELAGINMRLLRAGASTTTARKAMSGLVVPLFRQAGLSNVEVKELMDFTSD